MTFDAIVLRITGLRAARGAGPGRALVARDLDGHAPLVVEPSRSLAPATPGAASPR